MGFLLLLIFLPSLSAGLVVFPVYYVCKRRKKQRTQGSGRWIWNLLCTCWKQTPSSPQGQTCRPESSLKSETNIRKLTLTVSERESFRWKEVHEHIIWGLDNFTPTHREYLNLMWLSLNGLLSAWVEIQGQKCTCSDPVVQMWRMNFVDESLILLDTGKMFQGTLTAGRAGKLLSAMRKCEEISSLFANVVCAASNMGKVQQGICICNKPWWRNLFLLMQQKLDINFVSYGGNSIFIY